MWCKGRGGGELTCGGEVICVRVGVGGELICVRVGVGVGVGTAHNCQVASYTSSGTAELLTA